jgi:dipeptidyl aminopeptidase/acylaminoacyl peptidase
VFAVPFDIDKEAVTGSPVAVIEGVRRALNAATTGVAQFDTSATGTLAYVPGPATTASTDRRFAVADRAGMVTLLPPKAAQYVHVRVTRDGTRLAADTDNSTEVNVWIYEMDGKNAIQQLTFAGRNRYPVWSPDGVRVAFQSDRDGEPAIYAQRADGTGPIEQLTKPVKGEAHVPESWSPDGRYISFSILKGSKYSLSILSVSDRTIEPFANVQSFEPPGSVFSPDGRWLAYHFAPETRTAAENGGVFVKPFPATGVQLHRVPKVDRDFQPVWSRDGKTLFYVPLAATGRLAAVTFTTQPSVMFGSPETFASDVIAGRTSALMRAFDTLPDGRFIGAVSAAEQSLSGPSQSEMRVVLNWFEELKASVPASR